jgi:hypothetical protein
MEKSVELIPTRYKSKLSSVLSWPIGAEELSAGLIGVSQFSELETTFSFWGAHDIATAHTTDWMTLVKLQYNRRPRYFSDSADSIERGVLERHWPITVKPVLRENRKNLHDGIILQLPKVAKWLTERHALQVIGTSQLLIVWNAREDSVYVSTEDALAPERIRKS